MRSFVIYLMTFGFAVAMPRIGRWWLLIFNFIFPLLGSVGLFLSTILNNLVALSMMAWLHFRH